MMSQSKPTSLAPISAGSAIMEKASNRFSKDAGARKSILLIRSIISSYTGGAEKKRPRTSRWLAPVSIMCATGGWKDFKKASGGIS